MDRAEIIPPGMIQGARDLPQCLDRDFARPASDYQVPRSVRKVTYPIFCTRTIEKIKRH